MKGRAWGKDDYGYWYRLAEEVFGGLIPHLSDCEIIQLTPKIANWFAIPLSSENDIKEVANRPQPHIDFKLLENDSIRIGMRCNTVASVEKMANILDALQTVEKQQLIAELRKLDDDFQTQVLNKIKETNFAHVDRYECYLKIKSNQIDEETIDKVFSTIKEIREEGKQRFRDEDLVANPETPVLDLAFVIINRNSREFKRKLRQLKKMYEICLSVKTTAELRAQRKKTEDSQKAVKIIKLVCSKCGKEFPLDSKTQGMKFCDVDGMRVVVKIEKTP